MQIGILQSISALFFTYSHLTYIKRIDHNIFKIQLDAQVFYIDVTRGGSKIFCSHSPILETHYYAPLDKTLEKLGNSQILSCHCDGFNRILIFHCLQKLPYKTKEFFLHFEFTGRHTNAIITDHNAIITEALHHLNENKTSRIIKIGQKLSPLPQPKESKDCTSPFPKTASCVTEESKNKLLSFLFQIHQAWLTKKLDQERQFLIHNLSKTQTKLKNILHSLPDEEDLLKQKNALSENAKILLNHLYEIPSYAEKVTLENFENIEVTIRIPKPHFLPQDAINFMFKESKKLAKRAENIHLERENLNSKIEFLDRQMDLISHTQNPEILSSLKPKKHAKKRNDKIGVILFVDDYKISIGRNQNENQALLENAKANDIWMHIKDIPSSHLILHCGKKSPPHSTIQKSAEILARLNLNQKRSVEVDYTLRKFVKIKEGARVNYAKHTRLTLKL